MKSYRHNSVMGCHPFRRSPHTPGPLGHNDAASPDRPYWERWHAPGPLGFNDHADPNVIAKASEPDLSFLFRQCCNPLSGLDDSDYSQAATTLGVEIAAIKAVAEVETLGNAFDDSGRPRILFERHYFHRLTAGKFDAKHPEISSATAGGYGKFSAQYKKLERAYELDVDAALRSASWGRFQIMGDNFRAAGFASVKEFVRAMAKSESEHLKAFVNFVGSQITLLKALRHKDWPVFAAGFNGPNYKDNSYDTKLKDAFEKFKKNEAAKLLRKK